MEPVRIVKENYSREYGMWSVMRCKLADWRPLVWPTWGNYEITRVTREPDFEYDDEEDFEW